jgi:hypothetical protein
VLQLIGPLTVVQNMIKKVYYFLLGAFLLTFPCAYPSAPNISQILQEISESDRQDLDQFFQLLIKQESMGFTLFGQKPVTVANFVSFTYDYPHVVYCLIFEKGWAAWQRFPLINFSL